MSNSQSNEEAKGKAIGGFIGLVGGMVVSIICPPLAPVAIPVGFGAHTYGIATMVKYDNKPPELKKEGTTGDFIGGIADTIFLGGNLKAGVDYKDNDSKPNFHICGTNINPIQIREQKETKENMNKNILLENKKQMENYMNEYMKLVQTYPSNLPVDNIKTKSFNKNKFMAYKFICHNITPKEIIKHFESELKYYIDNPLVKRIYVARRKLDTLPIYFGWAAHSALLIKTKDGRWFVCEYGCEKDQNKVSLYEVKNVETEYFTTNDRRKYNKQICGSDMEKKVSIDSVKKLMENKMNKHSYWMLFWNCHIAQEMTREELGLKVNDKYLDEKYREEWQSFLF
jgi:hypothetical protein